MSHRTRMQRDLRGVDPNSDEARAIAARYRARRILNPEKPTVISVRKDIETMVKRQRDATEPLRAHEAIALLLRLGWQMAIVSSYLACLPFFRGWQMIRRPRAPLPAVAP